MAVAEYLSSLWYERRGLVWLLWPFGLPYRAAVTVRAALYRRRVLETETLPVPVIVVGNVSVGGTGKTPLIIWLADALAARGERVGIICRGYRGAASEWPQRVGPDSDPAIVGDEAALLAERTRCPVAAGPDRVAAARALIRTDAVSIILSDDGLQHYRLGRTLELAVVDGLRGLGNGLCLPAGPLREPAGRLASVDAIVVNDGDWGNGDVLRVRMQPRHFRQIATGRTLPIDELSGRRVHAVAGIGHPERFFRSLENHGLVVERHALPDHAAIGPADVEFGESDDPVIMTEKDAIKCRAFADERLWCLVADLEFRANDGERLMRIIERALEREAART